MSRRAACLLIFVLVFGSFALAGGTATNTYWRPTLALNSAGVTDDGNNAYLNGASGVQSYLGAGGNNVNLVTYATGRRLRFTFESSSTAWRNSGLPQSFLAEVTAYGVNYYGTYVSMGVGTTAQVALTIQFKYGGQTYELSWASLAAFHDTATSWAVTWTTQDYPGYPGFYPSNQATLSKVRNRSRTKFGVVNMPIRFSVQLA